MTRPVRTAPTGTATRSALIAAQVAAALPPMTAEEAAAVGRLAAELDARRAPATTTPRLRAAA